MEFKKINNISGWAVFLAALYTYVSTVEPTASFWDCGEFIAVSYKLMVPHPPGAPFFLLVGRLFSLLAGSDVTQVAFWVNMVSVLSSAFTSLFLFWTITLLARKLVEPSENGNYSLGQQVGLIGSGLVGALAYTWSDSAWFSAAEAEVYAMSSFFTAFVFWAMLKWENHADEEGADRWLVLIAYAMGLSIGVHLLNLVAVPALAYIYYFKRYEYSTKGLIVTFIVSLVILGLVQSGVIIYLPSIANWFEILFVNSFGLPFNSGIIFFVILFIAALVFGIQYSIRTNKILLNTGLICLVFIIIGYASYGIILVRSNFNPPIDENNPENAISFVSYLKREQYGDRPLLYGPLYNAQPENQVQGSPVYIKGEKKYEIVDRKLENVYSSKDKTLLPRIYSPQPNHIAAYNKWVKLPPKEKKPSFAQNIEYMFKYQFGWMYFRYFMWNFAGRESDIQDANWLSPFETKIGLPESLAFNKARNQFFMLPLIVGLIGLFFHQKKNGQSASIVGLLFFFTGLAIVIYLNQPPVEPRERDYTFAGSFYAFSVWIGLGVLGLSELFKKILKSELARNTVATALCLLAPAVMVAEGWDDHDRSDRYHSVDSAKNLLNSCAKNGILFTGGDNDTFPLWYVQEVEGFRTDVRVVNLSLLGTDWYIEQMKNKAYDSEPLPISMEYRNIIQGKNDYIPFMENPQVKGSINLKVYMDLVRSEDRSVTMPTNAGTTVVTWPSKQFFLKVDTNAVLASGIVPPGYEDKVVKRMDWTVGKTALYKNDLIVLDLIASNDWKRPIYFSTTLSRSNYMGLFDYFFMEGLAYRLLPVKNVGAGEDGVVNTPVMYENMMKKFFWRNLDNPHVYYDENYKRFPLNSRKSFFLLAEQLYKESLTEQDPQVKQKIAREVADYCMKVMPDNPIPYDVYTPQFINLYISLNDTAKAKEIAEVMFKRATDELEYLQKNKSRRDIGVQTNAFILQQLFYSFKNAGINDLATKYEEGFNKYYPMVSGDQGSNQDYGDE